MLYESNMQDALTIIVSDVNQNANMSRLVCNQVGKSYKS